LVASLLPMPSSLGELGYLLDVPSSHLPSLSLFVLLAFLYHAAVPPIPTATNLCCVSFGSGLVVDRFVSARSIILHLIHLVLCPTVLPLGSVHVHPTFCSGSIASVSLILFCFVFCFSIFFLTFFPFFFACNKTRSSLFNLPVYILMLCGVFAFDPNLWVVDVNDILTLGLGRMSFGLRFFTLRAKK
jgi:hypothetical protein